MSNLSVSIVIPTYKRPHLLGRAIRSALAECSPGDEIIVVDDGPTDDTKAVAQAFGPPVRYLAGEHRGAGAARNAGIAAATRDLVAFLDDDDEWLPGKLSWQRAILQHFPDILFVFSDFSVVRESGERVPNYLARWHQDPRPWDEILGPAVESTSIPGLPLSAPRFKLYAGRLFESLLHRSYVYTCTVVTRRLEAGEALHFAEDTPTWEDWECFARLADRGLAGYMDCETAIQHGHPGPRLTDAQEITRCDAAITIAQRVWGANPGYLGSHRTEYEQVLDSYRIPKIRHLLAAGQRRDARHEFSLLYHKPRSYALLTLVPGLVTTMVLRTRRRLRSLHRAEVK